MSYETNPYYNPEAVGLEIVAEIDYSDGNYQFDLRIVWRQKETGRLLTSRESGCSCPTPFDELKVEDMADYSYGFVRNEALDEAKREYGYDGGDISDFIDKLPR
jgi:hypothetical protein